MEAELSLCPAFRQASVCNVGFRAIMPADEPGVLCEPAAFRLRCALTLSRFCLFRLSARSRRPVQSSSGHFASRSWLIGASETTASYCSIPAMLESPIPGMKMIAGDNMQPAYTGVGFEVFIRSHQPMPCPGFHDPLASFGLACMQPAYNTSTDLAWPDFRQKNTPIKTMGKSPIWQLWLQFGSGAERSTCNGLTPGYTSKTRKASRRPSSKIHAREMRRRCDVYSDSLRDI